MRTTTRLQFVSAMLLASVSGAALAADGPSLVAHVNGVRSEARESKALQIADMTVKVAVRGSLAQTELTLRFANPSRDVLEGTFTLPLPKGSVVTGYALDIDGAMVDGVLEERYKAQEAYQSRVAVRIDPGLGEVDFSDSFSTRVFPIQPGNGRTVRVRFVTPLDPAIGYRLPLDLDAAVGKLRLEVTGAGGAIGLPRGVAGSARDGAVVFEGQQVRLNGDLAIASARPAAPLLVSEHPGEARFFELSDGLARLPASGAPSDTAHVFWDRSVSRSDDALAAERALLGDWLRARRVRRVSVTLFDSAAVETIADLSPEAAIALIARQRYRGGTDYTALGQVAVAPGAPCLLFSDGRPTLGATGVKLPCAARAVASGPEIDRALLTELTGSAPIELGQGNHAAVLAQLLGPASPVAQLKDDAGRAVDFVQLEAKPGAWRLVGRMPDSGGLRLTLADGSTRAYRQTNPVVPVFAGPGALWASRRLGAIGAGEGPAARLAFARKYAVASPDAAFVVLETPEDYARSEVALPESYPKALRDRYDRAVAAAENQKSSRLQALDGRVKALWGEVVRWYETKFDPAAPLPKRGRQSATEASGDAEESASNIIVTGSRVTQQTASRPRREGSSSPVPPPPPPPPPPIAAMAAPVAATDAGTSAAAPENAQAPAASIKIEPWSADRPYLARFDAARADYEAAIDAERARYGSIPLYWFDVAEWHFAAGRKSEAARAVEAALDLPTRDNQTLQIVAARLLRYGQPDRAIALLEKLVMLETDRPQPRRTLALALIERARSRQGAARTADLKRALGLLEEVIGTPWPDQYQGIYAIALVEANRLITLLGGRAASGTKLDGALIRPIDAGVRVSAEWNTPRTDIDLWVHEPNGEKVGYSNRLSARGGRYNQDMTQGYGPEEYMIRFAGKGEYEVRANTFAANRNDPNGPSTLTLRIVYDWGRDTEREELVVVEMKPEAGSQRLIGKVKVD